MMYLSMLEKIPHNVAEVSLADGLKTSPWDFYYHSTLVAPTTLTLLFSLEGETENNASMLTKEINCEILGKIPILSF